MTVDRRPYRAAVLGAGCARIAVGRHSATGGCSSWYLHKHGRNSAPWPGYTWRYRQRTRRLDQQPQEPDRADAQASPFGHRPFGRGPSRRCHPP